MMMRLDDLSVPYESVGGGAGSLINIQKCVTESYSQFLEYQRQLAIFENLNQPLPVFVGYNDEGTPITTVEYLLGPHSPFETSHGFGYRLSLLTKRPSSWGWWDNTCPGLLGTCFLWMISIIIHQSEDIHILVQYFEFLQAQNLFLPVSIHLLTQNPFTYLLLFDDFYYKEAKSQHIRVALEYLVVTQYPIFCSLPIDSPIAVTGPILHSTFSFPVSYRKQRIRSCILSLMSSSYFVSTGIYTLTQKHTKNRLFYLISSQLIQRNRSFFDILKRLCTVIVLKDHGDDDHQISVDDFIDFLDCEERTIASVAIVQP